jgi:hypothetical protein
MAINEPQYSTEYGNYSVSPRKKNKPEVWGSKLRSSTCTLTFTAAGYTTATTGDVALLRLPAGRIRLFPDLSRLICAQGTSTSDLDIGWAAYTTEGVAVVADENGLGDSIDVGGGAIDAALTLPAGAWKEFISDSGVDIVCSFDTANSPASGDLQLLLVYSQGN